MSEATPPELGPIVEAVRDGHHLKIVFGPQPKGKAPVLTAVAIVAMVLFFIGIFTAASLDASSPMMANIFGYSGLAALVTSLVAGVMAASRSGTFSGHRRGQVNVTRASLDTSLTADPYARQRMNSSATDEYPQFRRSIELNLVAQVFTAVSGLRKGKHEVRVRATSGVEYVIAVNRTPDEADAIASELRAHLELPTDPAQTVAELRDAVSEHTKGPLIMPQQERPQHERD